MDERELIRQRVDLVHLVGQEVRLKQSGSNWTGLCPFHEDKNPSFTVSWKTQRYKCWSCGESGDVFNWIMKRRNLDFRGALEVLAGMAGIELTGNRGPSSSKRSTFDHLMNSAQEFFRRSLDASKEALRYCEERGLDEQVRQRWGIGWAPDFDEALIAHLKKAGFSLEDAQALFLADGDQRNGFRSKFRARLMFPIVDERGSLVAYGGRLLGNGRPKYINSGDTPIFRKSNVLYGLFQAREACSKQNRAVLVEGYLDVIACHRAGVQTAVASLGTSLTEHHAKMLKRYADEVVILYDADEAGQKASERAVEVLKEAGLRTKVVMLPPGEDPDTLLKNLGPEGVVRAVEGGLAPTAYRLARLKTVQSPEQPSYWDAVVEILSQEQDSLLLERHLMEIAATYPGLNDPLAAREALRKKVRAHRAPTKSAATTQSAFQRRPRFGRMDLSGPERAIFLAVGDLALRAEAWPHATNPSLFTTELGKRLSMLLAQLSERPKTEVGAWIHELPESEDRIALMEFYESAVDAVDAVILRDSVAELTRKREEVDLRSGWRQAGSTSDEDLAEISARLRALRGVQPRVEPKVEDDPFGL